jgi:hypothetical protein
VSTTIFQQIVAKQQRQKGETGGVEKEQAGASGGRVVDSKDRKFK